MNEFLPGERLIEAAIFASREPVPLRALATLLPPEADLDAALASLTNRYQGGGVELVEAGPGLMFRTAPDLAASLKRVIDAPRRLPRAAMETLAIIAYHQGVTRTEIEDIRGVSLSQQTLDALLEAGLITSQAKREVPGRPNEWRVTPEFLTKLGLKDIKDLPKREDLLINPPNP